MCFVKYGTAWFNGRMTDERFIIGENGVPRPNPALPEESPEQEPERFSGEAFERRIVSYLLGQMSEEEKEQFEDECFAQKSWPSQIKLIEEELIDAYLHGEMEPGQRELFERNYLITEGRQERVKVAAALLRHVCKPDVVVTSPNVEQERKAWPEWLKAFWGERAGGLRALAALAMLVVIIGGVWLYVSRVRPPRSIATVSLTSSVVNRSEAVEVRTVKLPPDADALKVFLTLPTQMSPSSSYRVELVNNEGETRPLEVVAREEKTISVVVPAAELSRGQYVLQLFTTTADGAERRIPGSYFFNVE